jgi:hypothetical protein
MCSGFLSGKEKRLFDLNPNLNLFVFIYFYFFVTQASVNGTCVPCAPGTSNSMNSSFPLTCSLCPAGTFSNVSGSTSCDTCDSTSFRFFFHLIRCSSLFLDFDVFWDCNSASNGATSCTACPFNWTSYESYCLPTCEGTYGCESCSALPGCGFCGSTGRCLSGSCTLNLF